MNEKTYHFADFEETGSSLFFVSATSRSGDTVLSPPLVVVSSSLSSTSIISPIVPSRGIIYQRQRQIFMLSVMIRRREELRANIKSAGEAKALHLTWTTGQLDLLLQESPLGRICPRRQIPVVSEAMSILLLLSM